MRSWLRGLLTFFLFSNAFLVAQIVEHPLDPLNWQEYWTVLEVLRDSGRLDEETRFSMINLREPSKKVVLSWKSGQPIPRSAYALVRQGGQAFEAVLDLNQKQVSSWERLEGAQPNWLEEEFGGLVGEVKKDPRFVEAMKLRGYEDLTFIDCEIIPPGYFGTEEQKGRRVGHVHCQDAKGVRNTWTRGIAGLTAVVDLNEGKVLRIVDEDVVPVPSVSADYDRASIGEPRNVPSPMRVDQPLGSGFKIEGHQISWQNWRFHVRSDQRVGPVISRVFYQDGGRERSILYQGYLSEIFVPYMDPAFAWYARNFLDAGEFSAGGLTKPLLQGLDCPDHAVYFDSIVATDNGRPRTVPNTICVFERETGDMAWRHWAEEPESRVKRDLVVRSAAVLGNYDYIFDWVFQQSGSIQVALGATGIVETKMVAERAAGTGGEAADAYGRFVDPHVVAVNHDHYFSYRLDLDVDGTNNSLLIDRLRTEMLPEGNPRRSVWVRKPLIAQTESEAKMTIRLEKPALWRVISPASKNHVNYPTSYQVMPGKTGRSLLSPDDYPRRRAGFIDHHLWTTPYDEDERYAAGDFPTLSEPGKGLPNWTQADRPIANTDIVLWYTMAMHHLVRAEDWPVMPVMWQSFEIRPFDFFEENPAMDLPR
jgi:primary-amine oxidase